MELVVPIFALFLLLAIGLPVAFALMVSGGLGLWMVVGTDSLLSVIGTIPHTATSSLILTTVPMFILMAEFLAHGNLATRMFKAANSWTGRLPGGLAIATVVANAGMGALSGSSTASAATMSSVCVPEMRKYGYSEKLSLGTVASAGTLAAMIPPSIALIVYGVTTETSIGALFIAGVVPGLMSAVAYAGLIVVWVKMRPSIAAPTARFSWRQRLALTVDLWPVLTLIVCILGGLYAGLMTPTEAGAVGAFGALLISVAFGGLRLPGIRDAVARTIKTTGMILLIVVGATVFARYLAVTRVTQDITDTLRDSAIPATVVLLLVVAIYLVLGMFLDTLAMLLLTLPVVFPLITGLGYDPIWLGIIIVKTAEVGLASPPVGMNVFATVSSLRHARLTDAFAGAARFIIADLGVLALLILAPEIVMWLPGLS